MSDKTTCARCGSAECLVTGQDPEYVHEHVHVIACRDREIANLHAHSRVMTRRLEQCMETLTRARDKLDRILEAM